MKDNFPRYTMRINRVLLAKLHSVAAYHGRSVNKELEMLVRAHVAAFEKEHGAIPTRPPGAPADKESGFQG